MNFKPIILLFLFLVQISLHAQNADRDKDHMFKTDTIQSTKSYQLIAIPIAFYTPETNFGFGGGGQFFFLRDQNTFNNRLSNVLFSGIYTLNKQLMFEITPQVYFNKGGYFLDAKYQLEIYPNRFWGIGNNTPDSNEEVYNQTTHSLRVAFLKSIQNDLNFGLEFTFRNHEITEVDEGGILDSGTVLGSDRAVIVGLGGVFNYDTRDNVGSPNDGFYYQAKAQFASEALGSTESFNKFILDLRQYIPIGNKSLFAIQIFTEANFGDIPFQALAGYGGGSRARGYFFGRFLDKQMYVTQFELRKKIKQRWAVNVFGLVGEVAEEFGDFFSIRNVKPSVGAGARYKIFKDKDTWLRFDFGSGIDGNSGIYFGINEAF